MQTELFKSDIPDITASYFAGFFDGEGSCGIYDSHKEGGKAQFRVSLCQNDPRPLLLARKLFGGSIRNRFRAYRGVKRNNYEWYVHGKNSELFLRIIRPFTILKNEQIDVFLAAREIMCGKGSRQTVSMLRAVREAETILKSLKRPVVDREVHFGVSIPL